MGRKFWTARRGRYAVRSTPSRLPARAKAVAWRRGYDLNFKGHRTIVTKRDFAGALPTGVLCLEDLQLTAEVLHQPTS